MSRSIEKPSSIVALMDAHLWNDQTEVVDHLFPEAEAQYPEAERWFELKDCSTRGIADLKAKGALVLEWRSHAWVGLPADPGVIAAHLGRLGLN